MKRTKPQYPARLQGFDKPIRFNTIFFLGGTLPSAILLCINKVTDNIHFHIVSTQIFQHFFLVNVLPNGNVILT